MASGSNAFNSSFDRMNYGGNPDPLNHSYRSTVNTSGSAPFGFRASPSGIHHQMQGSFYGSPAPASGPSGSTSQEPMVLGSPPAAQFSSQSQFLPGYLLGDAPVKSASRAFSPGSSNTPGRLGNTSTLSGPRNHLSGSLRGLSSTARLDGSRCKESVGGRLSDKPGAPPVHSLFDVSAAPSPSFSSVGLDVSSRKSFHVAAAANRSELLNASHISQSSPSVFNRTANRSSILSPTQVDPFYTQGGSIAPGDVLDESWVTIFGFPPTSVRFILQQFSQYGTIIKHVVQNEGNWMHIHYQSKIQARNALSKNGKVIGSSIMVGVRPCIDKDIMGMGDTDSLCMPPKRKPMTPGGQGVNADDSQLSHQPLRPLTAAYRAAAMNSEVLQSNGTPTKNNGVVSKAMEYLFGW